MASTRVIAADVQITGTLDMRYHPIQNLNTNLQEYPTEPHQGASKLYVDTLRDEIVDGLPDTADNGEF
jgi:hypothetical protein